VKLSKKWSYRIFCCSLTVAVLLMSPATLLAESEETLTPHSIWDFSLEDLDNSGMAEPMDQVFSDIFQQEEISWREVVRDVLSGRGINLGKLSRALSQSFMRDLLSHSRILAKIMLVGVAIACLQILSETISSDGSNKIALQAAHMGLIVLAVLSFNDILSIARAAMEDLRTAFFAFIPSLTSLVLVSGAPVTAGALHPLVFTMGYFVSMFILDIAFPLIYTSIAIDMAGNIGGSDRVSGVADLLRQAAFIGIGLLMASFVGVVVAERAAAGVADGVALRTAKYISSTFIPVAGKMVGDTMDMFFRSILALRTALGIAGSLAVLGVVFSPLLKVLSCLLAWKISYAVLGSLCGGAVRRSLKCITDGITFVAMSLFVTCFVFIICLSLIAQAVKAY